ncbi:uncharacterized protein [Symphalangus syndactylus]|uniref:uncharacterized protein isoform X2 n=1 Tax=Symphalangus syndactylus TaxID=9590 RepID=UPI003005CB19
MPDAKVIFLPDLRGAVDLSGHCPVPRARPLSARGPENYCIPTGISQAGKQRPREAACYTNSQCLSSTYCSRSRLPGLVSWKLQNISKSHVQASQHPHPKRTL